MCKHSLQGAVNVNFEPQYKILKNVCLLSRLDWNRSTAINTKQYNTIQLYCQVTTAQGMCYGTKHTHTHKCLSSE